MLCEESSFGKILDAVVQRFCKGFDKGTAAGRAGFIKLHAVYSLIFDLDTFHILAADIQDTVYLRVKEGGGVVMGYGLYLSFIQEKCCFDQGFSVSGRTGVSDLGSFWKLGIDFLDGLNGSSQGTSVVIAVERVQQGAVFSYQSSFGGGRAGVNTQVAVSLVCRKIPGLYIVLALTAVKFFVIFLCGEERFHTADFKIHFNGSFQSVSHGSYRYPLSIWLYIKSRADSGKQMRVLRYDSMLLIQL